jgi:hypothetical protein
MGWEFRTGWTVLWTTTALMVPGLLRGRVRLQLQAAICLSLVLFGLGGAVVFQRLPGFHLFQLPSRMFLLTSLPTALLVGAATQAMFDTLRSDPQLRRTIVRLLIMILLAGLVTTATLSWPSGWFLGVPLLAYWGSLLVTFPLVCWLLWRSSSAENQSSRSTVSRFQLAWGVLLGADLWAMGWPLVSVHPPAPIYAPPAWLQLLLERSQNHGRVLDREVPGELGSTPLCFALPILNRLEPVRGYNPLDIRRYREYVRFISDRDGSVPPDNRIGNFPVINKNLLDLLGTRYLLQPSNLQPMEGEPMDVAHDPRWRKFGEDPAPEAHLFVPGGLERLPPFTLYENREAFPRAFVVPRAEPLPQPDRILNALKTTDLRRVVFLEGIHLQSGAARLSGEFQPARIVAYQPNHVNIEVDPIAPGYLILTDPWYPGWTCTVDGRLTQIHRADYLFRAVAVPAGKHQVHFRFDPGPLRLGEMITTAALVAVLGLNITLLALRIHGRDRKPSGAGPSQLRETTLGWRDE